MAAEPKHQDLEQVKREIDEILRRVDSQPVLDSRTAEEIVGYNEHGLPRPANCIGAAFSETLRA